MEKLFAISSLLGCWIYITASLYGWRAIVVDARLWLVALWTFTCQRMRPLAHDWRRSLAYFERRESTATRLRKYGEAID